jgi:double-stranded uracil-DNA glycosylase
VATPVGDPGWRPRVASVSPDEEGTVGTTRAELEAFRDVEVADLAGPRPRLAFVGINPSLMTAATGTHFAHPSNRFYPALHLAGLTSRQLPRGVPHSPEDRAELTGRGIAITNIVARATARASDLTDAELRAGAVSLVDRLETWGPQVVAIAGPTAYRAAFGDRRATLGRRPGRLGGAELWLVPNPSGLNAHETTASLARWYRQVAEAAGLA